MTSIFRPDKNEKYIRKETVWHGVSAPSKDTMGSLESYVQFELAPQYKGLTQYYNNYNLCLKIQIDQHSVDEDYFRNMDNVLRKYCPSLIGRYKIVEM